MTPTGASEDNADRARLEALRRLDILDTPTEAGFDRIAQLACALLAAPMGMVSLVDDERVWFKARVGLDAAQAARRHTFCTHAIETDDVMVVADAANDARFADNPVVMDEPPARFYAGAPMVTREGHRLGAVCVIDHAPRPAVEAALKDRLADLAALAVELIELRRAGLKAHREVESRRVAEAAVARALIIARDAIQSRETMLANVSHELRTPLNGVTGMLSLLQRCADGEEMQRMIAIALDSAEALIVRVEDLLNAAALSAHATRLEERPVRPSALLAGVVREFTDVARGKGLVLSVEDTFGSIEVLSDQAALRHVLVCLLDNAVKFTTSGVVTVTGSVTGAVSSGLILRFAVSDTGPGVPEAARRVIFERFRMLEDGLTRRTNGVGLGLFIAREFVALMGGDIGVDSAVGEGATFWFTAPAKTLRRDV